MTALRRVLSLFGIALITRSLAFTTPSTPLQHYADHRHRIRGASHHINLFREFISDDNEDLRAHVEAIEKVDQFEQFLAKDERLCLIKFYAPFCKVCKVFGVKFRKLAFDEGDRIDAGGNIVHSGDVRFGEVEYTAGMKLCKSLALKKFPTVMMFRGGRAYEKLSEVSCTPKRFVEVVDEMKRLRPLPSA